MAECEGIQGVEADCFVEITEGHEDFTQTPVGGAPVDVGGGGGLQQDSFIRVGEGALEIAYVDIGGGAVDVRPGVLGVEHQGLGGVGDGLSGLALEIVGLRAAEVGVYQGTVEPDGEVE